jgi:hypothetical protein
VCRDCRSCCRASHSSKRRKQDLSISRRARTTRKGPSVRKAMGSRESFRGWLGSKEGWGEERGDVVAERWNVGRAVLGTDSDVCIEGI